MNGVWTLRTSEHLNRRNAILAFSRVYSKKNGHCANFSWKDKNNHRMCFTGFKTVDDEMYASYIVSIVFVQFTNRV